MPNGNTAGAERQYRAMDGAVPNRDTEGANRRDYSRGGTGRAWASRSSPRRSTSISSGTAAASSRSRLDGRRYGSAARSSGTRRSRGEVRKNVRGPILLKSNWQNAAQRRGRARQDIDRNAPWAGLGSARPRAVVLGSQPLPEAAQFGAVQVLLRRRQEQENALGNDRRPPAKARPGIVTTQKAIAFSLF